MNDGRKIQANLNAFMTNIDQNVYNIATSNSKQM